MNTYGAYGLLSKILGYFGDHDRAQCARQCLAEHTQETGFGHHDQAFETNLPLRSLELGSYFLGKHDRFMLTRIPLAARAVMCSGAATPAGERAVVEHASGPVRFEVAIVQAGQRIGELPGDAQLILESLQVVKDGTGLTRDDNSNTHRLPSAKINWMLASAARARHTGLPPIEKRPEDCRSAQKRPCRIRDHRHFHVFHTRGKRLASLGVERICGGCTCLVLQPGVLLRGEKAAYELAPRDARGANAKRR